MEDNPKRLSSNFTNVYLSHEPSCPSQRLFDNISSFDTFLEENLSRCHYLPNGDGVVGKKRLYPEDINWGSPSASVMLDMFTEVINDDKMFTRTPSSLAEAGMTLNAPIITALHSYGGEIVEGKDVAILCAGNGEDSNRLAHSTFIQAESLHFIGSEEFNSRARSSAAGVPAHWDPRFLHEIPDNELGQYDTIICHHGLHHILATPEGEDAFANLINNHLKVGGRFLGDKVSLVGARGLVLPDSEAGRNVWLDSVDFKEGIEGTMYLGVGSRVWKDPILTNKRLYDQSLRWKCKTLVLDGKGIYHSSNLKGTPLVPPRTVEKAALRSETRVMTYIELERTPDQRPIIAGAELPPPVLPSPKDMRAEAPLWVEREPPDYVVAQLSFRVVKGVVVGTSDVWNVAISTALFSHKLDGICGRVLVGSGSSWLAVDQADRSPPYRYFNSTSISRVEEDPLKLQVEVFYDQLGKPNAVVVDPIHMGPCQPSQFAARVRLYSDFLVQYPRYSLLLPQKKWYNTWEEVAPTAVEGVVIMNLHTPPPYTPDLARACHYVKRSLTIDILNADGKVDEHQFLRDPGPDGSHVGAFIRPRPDKMHPNSPETVAKLYQALPFSVVGDLFQCMANPNPPVPDAVESFLARLPLITSDEVSDFADPEKRHARAVVAWVLVHRSREVLPPVAERALRKAITAMGVGLGDTYGVLIERAPPQVLRTNKSRYAPTQVSPHNSSQ